MSWDGFYQFSEMKIEFEDSASTVADIYGNGLNQVAIILTVLAVDTYLQPIALTPADLAAAASLCDYRTGELINRAGTSTEPWFYSDSRSAYCIAESFGAQPAETKQASAGQVSCTYYLSSTAIADGKLTAFTVTAPDRIHNTCEGGDFPGYLTVRANLAYAYDTDDMVFPREFLDITLAGEESGLDARNMSWVNYYLRFNEEISQSRRWVDYSFTKEGSGSDKAADERFHYKQTGDWVCQDNWWAEYNVAAYVCGRNDQ